MLILGIETSCDETAAAVVEDGRVVLSNVISSQIPLHRQFGGVVPEVASRNHTLKIMPVINEAMERARVKSEDIDAIAVTRGGGLIGALLVGVTAAKTLSYVWDKPLIAVNHTLGHIAANYLEEDGERNCIFGKKDNCSAHKENCSVGMMNEGLSPPFICLVVSGGHTVVLHVKSYTDSVVIAKTVDDSVGECFDKVARKLGLPYPGGPEIDRLARLGQNNITFMKSNIADGYKFSYSGLKTAVINYIHGVAQRGEALEIENLACSFSYAALQPLVNVTMRASRELGIKNIALAGGVAANSLLRELMTKECVRCGCEFKFPKSIYCTDNAAMVASMGYYNFVNNVALSDLTLNPVSTIEGFRQ